MEATQCSGEVREALYCQDCEFKARMESLTLEGTARRAAPILRPENGQRFARQGGNRNCLGSPPAAQNCAHFSGSKNKPFSGMGTVRGPVNCGGPWEPVRGRGRPWEAVGGRGWPWGGRGEAVRGAVGGRGGAWGAEGAAYSHAWPMEHSHGHVHGFCFAFSSWRAEPQCAEPGLPERARHGPLKRVSVQSHGEP